MSIIKLSKLNLSAILFGHREGILKVAESKILHQEMAGKISRMSATLDGEQHWFLVGGDKEKNNDTPPI